MTLQELLVELNYLSDIEQVVQSKLIKDEKKIREIADTAYVGDDCSFELCKRMPLTRLAVVTYLLLRKYDEYAAKGIPEKIIFDTFRDVSVRADLYYNKTGKVGISKEDVIWFRHIININIFKIGVLQFQPFEMVYLDEETIGEPYMTFEREQKEVLPTGAPVINCHIQYGADLSSQMVGQSMKDAERFFREYFPQVQYKAFLCYSWLLYPPMVSNLPKQSKIRGFAEKFSIIGSCDDSEQAVENLFENGNFTVLPKATSLQKMAAEKKKLLGFACGIIEI